MSSPLKNLADDYPYERHEDDEPLFMHEGDTPDGGSAAAQCRADRAEDQGGRNGASRHRVVVEILNLFHGVISDEHDAGEVGDHNDDVDGFDRPSFLLWQEGESGGSKHFDSMAKCTAFQGYFVLDRT